MTGKESIAAINGMLTNPLMTNTNREALQMAVESIGTLEAVRAVIDATLKVIRVNNDKLEELKKR